MAAVADSHRRARTPLLRVLRSEYFVLLLSAAYCAACAPFTPDFATGGNIANVLATLLPLFVAALGQTVVLITGGIDLSAMSIVALASIAGAAVMSGEQGLLAGSPSAVPAALLAMALVGAAAGALNGVAIACLRLPPFIVTLTSMMFFSGLAIALTQSRNIGALPAAFNALGGSTWLTLAIAIVAGAGVHVMLARSLWGRWLYAVGHNPRVARVSGVPVPGVVIGAYVASGVLAAAASVLYTGQAESGSPVLAQRLLLDIICATVIGGASLFGGRGGVLGTLFGALFLKLIDNSLNLMGRSHFSIMMVKGAVILGAAVLDMARSRLEEK